MKTNVIHFWLCSIVCSCCFFGAIATAQSSTAFQIIRRVDTVGEKSPASAEAVQAFDISPDGSLLAVLFQSESHQNSWLRILIENVETGRALMDLRLPTGTRPDRPQLPTWYVPHGAGADPDFWGLRSAKLSGIRVARCGSRSIMAASGCRQAGDLIY